MTYLSNCLINFLFMWIHFNECPDLCQIHTFSISQCYNLVKCKDQVESIVCYFWLFHASAIFWNLKEVCVMNTTITGLQTITQNYNYIQRSQIYILQYRNARQMPVMSYWSVSRVSQCMWKMHWSWTKTDTVLVKKETYTYHILNRQKLDNNGNCMKAPENCSACWFSKVACQKTQPYGRQRSNTKDGFKSCQPTEFVSQHRCFSWIWHDLH